MQTKMGEKTIVKKIIIYCLVLFSVPQFVSLSEEPVQTSTGPILGTEHTEEHSNKSVQPYLGIPFAEPPIGDLRFKKTVSVKRWSEPIRASKIASSCLQVDKPEYPWVRIAEYQSEDCLYLNIWVPLNVTKKMPVMIWIHDGDFSTGGNGLNTIRGYVLAAQADVIVVEINYRLGILGFISAGTDEAPGNMGLHDMLEGIKWTKTNIDAFGGDSNKITLFGHGIAIGLLCLSPMSKDLFNRAILVGGAPTFLLNDNRWKNTDLAQKVAKSVDCVSDTNTFILNANAVIECLRKKDAKQLVELSSKLNDYVASGFSPIVGDKFMPRNPRYQLTNGNFNKVDVMVGHTQDEGSLLLTKTDPETFGDFGEKNPVFNKTFGADCIRKALKDFPPELVVQYYLGGLKEDDYDGIREQTYHAIGDFFVVCPNLYFAERYAKERLVYAYYFNHIAPMDTNRFIYKPWKGWMGSVHSSEVAFGYGQPLNAELDLFKIYNENEKKLSKWLIIGWTNFVIYGYQAESWQKFSRTNPYFHQFYITNANRTNYLERHKKNCEFFRPFIGMV